MQDARGQGTGPAVQAEGLIKTYTGRSGTVEAVRGVDLEVQAGEVFGFLGPNGAGKSTTMRIIAGLIQPTSGQVRVDGHDLARDPLAVKAITSFIPDRPFLYEKLTAFETLELVGGLHRMPRARVAERGQALLRRFELADWADALVESFSHGMKQRLVFAAALLPEPRLLVVDEPMVGLDPKSGRLVKDIFLKLSERGTTIFMCTHVLEIAEKLCDRVGVMMGGKMIACGTLDELRSGAKSGGTDLESLFLSLTGGSEYSTLLRYL